MPNTAAAINVKLRAGTAELVEDMTKAKVAVREFGASGVTETKATRAAFKALEGNILDNKRAAEQFAEKILHLGGLAKIAFPLLGGLAFGGMLVELGQKVVEFYNKFKERPEKAAEGFKALMEPIQRTNDELLVANDRLENQLAKLEGRRPNALKQMLDEAIESGHKLAEVIGKDFDALTKYLGQEENRPGLFARTLLGEVSTDYIADAVKRARANVDRINRDADAAVTKARLDDNVTAEKEAQRVRNEGIKGEADFLVKFAAEMKMRPGQRSQIEAADLQRVIEDAKAAGVAAGLMARNAATSEKVHAAEDRKEASAEAAKAQAEADKERQEVDRMLLTAKHRNLEDLEKTHRLQMEMWGAETLYSKKLEELGAFNAQRINMPPQVREELLTAAYGRSRQEGLDKLAESIGKLEADVVKMTADRGVPSAVGGASTQGVTQFFGQRPAPVWDPVTKELEARAKQAGELHRQTLADLNEEMAILQSGVRIGLTQEETQLAIRNVEKERLDLQTQMVEAQGGMNGALQRFFLDLKRNTDEAGHALYEALSSALDRTSTNLGRLATGQKTDWARDFQQIGGQMATSGIHSMLSQGLSKIPGVAGMMSKRGETPMNPLYVSEVQSAFNGLPGTGTGTHGGLLSRLAGILGLGGGGAGAAGEAAGMAFPEDTAAMIASVPGLAGGGDVTPGQAYMVGESGRELFVPGTSGRIVSNSEMRGVGGGAVYQIDARGTDPALTEARVRQALAAVHGSAVATSDAVQRERMRRTPRGRH